MPLLFPHKGARAGQVVITGGCVSLTLMLNEQVPPVLVLILTVVVPTGKKDPEAGTAVTVPQFAEIEGNGKFTTAPHCPGALVTTISAGQVILQVPPGLLAVDVEKLLPAIGSTLPLLIEAVLLSVPERLSAALTTNVNVAVAPFASIAIVAVIKPEVPGCGELTTHP